MKLSKVFLIFVAAFVLVAAFFIFRPRFRENLARDSSELHNSYFSQSQFYDDAYAHEKPQTYEPQARAILVNHHLLAGSFIAEGFNVVATTAPVTVLLVSPNHFDAGKGSVITSAEDWQTPYGVLESNKDFIKQLSNNNLASIEESPFTQEHGVSGIVAFIKKSLPNATVVPVIFRDRLTAVEAEKLADEYFHILPANTLLVGSFDFSHYLTGRAADFHDLENLAVVENADSKSIYNLDIDSRPGLTFFLGLLKQYGYGTFNILEHSNSAVLTHEDALETTSYITGYFTPGESGSSSVYTLLSLGGVGDGPKVVSALEKNSPNYGLTYMERLFYGQDSTEAFWNGKDPTVQSVFARLGVEMVSQAVIHKNLGPIRVVLLNCGQTSGATRLYIDQGSDAVICQGAQKNYMEMYKDKPIIYAAGNFLDFNTLSGPGKSLGVGLSFQNNKLGIVLLPIGTDSGQLKLLVGKESDTVLAEMARNSPVSAEIKNQIKLGELQLTMDQ